MSTDADRLYKKGLYLEYINVSYNILEAVAAIVFGGVANSIALVGFGLDSIVESLSGLILIWRLKQHGRISEEQEEKIERRATRFVSVTFFILGAYILFESIKKFVTAEVPDPSLAGIILAIVSLLAMPFMAWQKYKTGKQINSRALVADSKETIACAFLSVALLLGLGLNYLFGLWQADPVVGLIIVFFLFKEGWEEWHEEEED
ncbi:MAG: cation diffusion facilitator family transporter [Dehalococcoidales bacterium]|nr:cation diffusion facilitator family transporter [Dehalococcoidales bacterium]